MSDYDIKLVSSLDSSDKGVASGYASFRRSGADTWSRVTISGLRPYCCYFIFYIMQNRQVRNAAEIGRVFADSQGNIEFEREFDNSAASGYSLEEQEVIGVVAVERNEFSLAAPVAGFTEEGIEWKQLVSPYITALDHGHCISGDYRPIAQYDTIIDSLPPSSFFEVRDKIEKAVELGNLCLPGLERLVSGIDNYESALLIRMCSGDFVLYLLGLPGIYGCLRPDYDYDNFRTFLSSRTGETLQKCTVGFWCRYIM